MVEVTQQAFTDTIDRWMADVKAEAIKLFREGVPHDFCVNIAMKIVEGKDTGRARRLQKFGAVQ